MDISATGSNFLAFYSDEAMVPAGVMWAVKLPREDAKLLALWFNSTPSVLELLLNRKETRGAFLQLDQYSLENIPVLDPNKLNEAERARLLSMFEDIRRVKAPSLLEQLASGWEIRKRLDLTILGLLGFEKEEADEALTRVYPLLAQEIQALRSLMAGKLED